ncbi:MAG: phosphatidylglycerophosphatase A [candidate division WOR-3 bacterium]
MRKVSYLLSVVMYIAFILFLGLYPKVRVIPFKFDPSSIFHSVAFFLLILFLIDQTKNKFVAFVFSVFLGVFIEVLQKFIPGRISSRYDFIFDIVGIILGMVLNTKGRNFVFKVIASFGGIGYIPYAPGTIASLLFTVLLYWWGTLRKIFIWQIFLIILPVAIYVAQKVEDLKGDDPRMCVIDEIVGMCIPLLMVPHHLAFYGISFLSFRIFDIWKPFGISKMENKVKGGLGIVLDDLVAGIYAAIFVLVIRLFLNLRVSF